MSLGKLVNKPTLEWEAPEVINNLTETPNEAAVTVVIPEDDTRSLIVEYSIEVENLRIVRDSILEAVTNVKVPLNDNQQRVLGESSINSSTLQQWMSTGDTRWPTAVMVYDSYSWDSGNLEQMIWTTVEETFNELRNEMDYISLSIGSTGSILGDRRDLYRENLDKYRRFTNNIQAALEEAKEELPSCLINKMCLLSLTGKSSTIPSLTINGYGVVEKLRALRTLIRYSAVVKQVDWRATKQNLLNSILQRLGNEALAMLSLSLGNIVESALAPIANLIEDASELSSEEACGAFDALIGTVAEEVLELRNKYIEVLIEEGRRLTDKMTLRNSILTLAGGRVTMSKQEELIDVILEGVEALLQTGTLSEELSYWVKNRMKTKETTKPTTAKGSKG
jgi:hypothetical protein